MKFLIVICISLISPALFAGDAKGNGGDIILCEESSNKAHLKSLDEFEAEHPAKHGFKIDKSYVSPGSTLEQAVENLIGRLKSKTRKNKYTFYLKNFYKEAVFTSESLGNINDEGLERKRWQEVFDLPKGCKLKQVINQNSLRLKNKKVYLINEKLWLRLDMATRASLVLHEFVYRENPMDVSTGVRNFVAYVLSDQLKRMSDLEYIKFLQRNEIRHASKGLISIDSYSFVEFDANENMISGISIGKNIFQINTISDPNAKLYPVQLILKDVSRVLFYSSGSVKSLCPLDFEQSTNIGLLSIFCPDNFIEKEAVRLSALGQLQEAVLLPGVFQLKNYKLKVRNRFSGQLEASKVFINEYGYVSRLTNVEIGWKAKSTNQFVHLKGNIDLFENGYPKEGRLAQVLNYSNAKLSLSADGRLEFYPSGELKKLTSIISGEALINGRKQGLVPGSSLELYKDGSVKRIENSTSPANSIPTLEKNTYNFIAVVPASSFEKVPLGE